MPVPMIPIYVVVAAGVIGGVAAVVAFKEFVYEPHIAPKFEAWSEERRRRLRSRRAIPVAVATFPQAEDDGHLRRDSLNKKRSDDQETMSVELEDLIASEQYGWRSKAPSASNLRHRKTAGVLEESNTFIPYDPISPSQASDSSRSDSPTGLQHIVPAISRSPPPVIHSPSARPVLQSQLSAKSEPPPAALVSPRLPTPVSLVASPMISAVSSRGLIPSHGAHSPASVISPISSRRSSGSVPARSAGSDHLDRSISSTSSFTPAVVGPQSSSSMYGSPRSSFGDAISETGRSTGGVDVTVSPASRTTSPFVNVHASARHGAISPFSDLHAARTSSTSPFSDIYTARTASPFSDIHHEDATRSPPTNALLFSPGQDSDFDLSSALSPSLRSGMFSPGMERDDELFEVGSAHESDLESWASIGRRTPEP